MTDLARVPQGVRELQADAIMGAARSTSPGVLHQGLQALMEQGGDPEGESWRERPIFPVEHSARQQ